MLKRLFSPLRHPTQSVLTADHAPESQTPPSQTQNPPHPRQPYFAASAAGLPSLIHRLSQPLTALRGSLELGLLTEGNAADYRLALEEALAQADHLVHLINWLRDMVEAGESGEADERAPLGDLVKAAREELEPLAATRGVTLLLESHPDSNVRGSAKWLRHAVYRTVHRALERSPDRGTVQISLSKLDREACLRVSDQGPAARPGELDHLARASSLGQLFADASKRGTLDWAMAKLIFEAQGGLARVECEPGQGCCFVARLLDS